METIFVDVLVCGGGMSGMTCAAFATDAGAKTLVVEKQERIGGSSNYSAGMLWGPQTFDKLRSWIPRGDPVLQKAWLKHYRPAVQWMRENGMSTGQRFDGIMTISIGFPIQIAKLQEVQQSRDESRQATLDLKF